MQYEEAFFLRPMLTAFWPRQPGLHGVRHERASFLRRVDHYAIASLEAGLLDGLAGTRADSALAMVFLPGIFM
jgi:hypothetical protein